MRKLFLYSLLFILSTNLFAKDISAYLIGKYVSTDIAKERLAKAGFQVVAQYSPVKEGETIIFTNDALKAEAAKPKRAHAAVLRMFIDNKEKVISITNPLYFGRAFMQDEYDSTVFQAQLTALKSAFNGLKDSTDSLDEDDIAGFHFMMGMPYYNDVDKLGEASHNELLSKARKYKKGKNLIFELKLSDKSTLLGYELDKRTKKFVKKIGRANAAVLPYCISIEDGLASALGAKYYLAVSYPLLTMGEFMTISTVPGAINKDLSKPFK